VEHVCIGDVIPTHHPCIKRAYLTYILEFWLGGAPS